MMRASLRTWTGKQLAYRLLKRRVFFSCWPDLQCCALPGCHWFPTTEMLLKITRFDSIHANCLEIEVTWSVFRRGWRTIFGASNIDEFCGFPSASRSPCFRPCGKGPIWESYVISANTLASRRRYQCYKEECLTHGVRVLVVRKRIHMLFHVQ